MIVGTHADLVNEDLIQRTFQYIEAQINLLRVKQACFSKDNFLAISCETRQGLPELVNKVLFFFWCYCCCY
jgi:hypothetical protein